jgi:glycosyltransferase involved in cell wall biosynthesis
MQQPLLSIVVPTWNRSNVLRLSIKGVLRSTVTDWEMLVVGDACTADASVLLNLVDNAYRYEDPDHWRLPPDSPQVPYRFTRG